MALRLLNVFVGKRQVEVFCHGKIVEQVIALEDESDVLLVELRPLLAVHLVDRLSREVVLARPLVVEQP